MTRSSAASESLQRERAVGIANAPSSPAAATAALKARYSASVVARSAAGSASIGGSRPSRQPPSMNRRSCGLWQSMRSS